MLALRQEYLQTLPQANAIFDFLERHWPKLVNSIPAYAGTNDAIPATNNAVELVTLAPAAQAQVSAVSSSTTKASAALSPSSMPAYLAVFEKVYRFTPFSQSLP